MRRTPAAPADVSPAALDYIMAKRPKVEIPADWAGRDRHLEALAKATGLKTINRLLSFVAYEVSHCRTPGQFYKALSSFYEYTRGRGKKQR